MKLPNPFGKFMPGRPRPAAPLETIHGLPTPATRSLVTAGADSSRDE